MVRSFCAGMPRLDAGWISWPNPYSGSRGWAPACTEDWEGSRCLGGGGSPFPWGLVIWHGHGIRRELCGPLGLRGSCERISAACYRARGREPDWIWHAGLIPAAAARVPAIRRAVVPSRSRTAICERLSSPGFALSCKSRIETIPPPWPRGIQATRLRRCHARGLGPNLAPGTRSCATGPTSLSVGSYGIVTGMPPMCVVSHRST